MKASCLVASLALATSAIAESRPRIYFPRNIKRAFTNSTVTQDVAFPPQEEETGAPSTTRRTSGSGSGPNDLLSDALDLGPPSVITIEVPSTVQVTSTTAAQTEDSVVNEPTLAQPTDPASSSPESDSAGTDTTLPVIVVDPSGVSTSETPETGPTTSPEATTPEETTSEQPDVTPPDEQPTPTAGAGNEESTTEVPSPTETEGQSPVPDPTESASPTEGSGGTVETSQAGEEPTESPTATDGSGTEQPTEEPGNQESSSEAPLPDVTETLIPLPTTLPSASDIPDITDITDITDILPTPTPDPDPTSPSDPTTETTGDDSTITVPLPDPDPTTTTPPDSGGGETTISPDPPGSGTGGTEEPTPTSTLTDPPTDPTTVPGDGDGQTPTDTPPVSEPTSTPPDTTPTDGPTISGGEEPGPTGGAGNATSTAEPPETTTPPVGASPDKESTLTSIPILTTVQSAEWLPTSLAIDAATTSEDQDLPAATGATDTLPPGTPDSIDASDSGMAKPNDATLIRIVFTRELHYEWVVEHIETSQQIFTYLPEVLSFGESVGISDIKMMRLEPVTGGDKDWFPTGAFAYVPTKIIPSLQANILLPNSAMYHPDHTVAYQLAQAIDSSYGIFPGSDGNGDSSKSDPGGDPFTNKDDSKQEKQTPQQAGATAGITMGAISVAVAYGAAMFIVARRYKRKKQQHRRASSITNSSEMRYTPSGSPPVMGGALLSRDFSSYGGVGAYGSLPGGRESHGSGRSNGANSGRTAYISAPVAAENSLGWN